MKHSIAAIRMLVFMTVLTGVLYPLAVTAIGATLFGAKAGGGLVDRSRTIVGSHLIAQKFESDRYFWSRPSAVDYNGGASSGSNQGQASAALKATIDERRAKLKAAHPGQAEPPQDLLFASGSGLDPHLSPEAAFYQLNRVSQARKMDEKQVRSLIDEATEGRQFGILGNPRVNVIELNLALDRAQGITAAPTPAPTPAPAETK